MDPQKFSWIPNGFSLDEVNQKVPLNKQAESQLPQGKFIVGYTGTLGVANAMDVLIETAEHLQQYTDIAFVLVGMGKEKALLKAQVKNRKLSNVYFIEPIPKVEMQAMLNRFNACYIGWLDDEIYRFGIGANKIPEYLYSAKPIIHSYSGACDPVDAANAGVLAQAGSSEKVAEAVLVLYEMSKEKRKAMGDNGRKVAIDEYEYSQLGKKLASVIFK
ncbi:glycosyltransferase family 4 protein [Oceanimonas sp. NS1]|nr:glycosyltransferase family 4 protein [Oceanimonas sp. NS1]